ncbi:hypothetical protein Ddye_023188 [Dipteronia dyeriana]|uniref:Glycosyltransferase n=1 Tax=Dipteronia dyeriana TaxID=168575 RepID=A0AAD9TTG8_9ROSI|nr:hypothetical protein Ddye_023188 [Dipteronia dyeriana]
MTKNPERVREMKKAELIFIPLPGTSHLLPILELAKRLIDRDDRISIAVLLIKLPFGGNHAINTKSHTADTNSRIRFIDVPQVDPPPMQLLMTSPETYFSLFTDKNTPHVRKIVEDIVSSHSHSDSNDSVRVTGLVIDVGFLRMMDVAIQLALPCYIFFASNIGNLSLMSYLSTRHADADQISTVEFQSFLDSELVTLPGFVNPVPVSVMPSGFFNKDGYTIFVQVAHRLKNVNGIIVNTFSELESYALNSFSRGGSNPPLYTVGPLLDLQVHQANHDNSDKSQKILKWLDDQPESSVVFLCFGMGGTFGPEQVKEIATGLEKSEYRFLWTLRVSDLHQSTDSDDGYDPDLFPGGFLERIGGRGMICRWAPQVKVLQHKAIGGFVSHCGWNSILESLCCGVPIVTWPLYAEQKFNAFMMAKELGLAAAIESGSGKDNGGLMAAEEIAKAVRNVMDGDQRDEIRKKTMEMAEISRKSLMEGGSSFVSIGKFIDLNF